MQLEAINSYCCKKDQLNSYKSLQKIEGKCKINVMYYTLSGVCASCDKKEVHDHSIILIC